MGMFCLPAFFCLRGLIYVVKKGGILSIERVVVCSVVLSLLIGGRTSSTGRQTSYVDEANVMRRP